MSQVGLALRWIAAVAVAIVVYVVVFVLAALIGNQIGVSSSSLNWPLVIATAAAIIAGVLVTPGEQWSRAALVLWLLAFLFPLWLLIKSASQGAPVLENVSEIGATVVGGFIAFISVRTVMPGRKIDRVSG
jgi:hypothetical protein